MKYLVGFLFGLGVGIAAALALLFFNPLTAARENAGPAASWELDYALTPPSATLLTHADQLRMPVTPPDTPLLWEQGLRGIVLGSFALDGGDGAVAMATRISVPSPDSNLLLEGVMVDDFWLLTAPGRGSVFVHAVDNQWPLLKDTVARVDLFRRPWTGAMSYDPTVGPGAGGRATALGLSGEFAGLRGSARNRIELDRYDTAGFAGLSGKLLLTLDAEPR